MPTDLPDRKIEHPQTRLAAFFLLFTFLLMLITIPLAIRVYWLYIVSIWSLTLF